MKVRIETQEPTTIVIAEGRLDFAAAAGFQQQLERLLGSAGATVLVDCAALDYVSSAGLRAFLLAARAAQRAGSTFALCALRPAVREVLELSGFDRILAVHADRTAAVASAPVTQRDPARRIAVPGDAAQLAVLTRFLQEFWSAAQLPAAAALGFELALEEVFMNVVMHGAPAGGKPQVEVSLHRDQDGLAMTIADDGPEFNPLSVPAPDVSAPLAERPVGGHGVSLVRQMMDSVSYRRAGGHNELTLSKRIPS